LSDQYLDGILTDERRQEVEHHLNSCDYCARFMEEKCIILGLLSDLEEAELPPGFEQRLKSRLQQAANQAKTKFDSTPWSARPWYKWGAAIAAVFMLAFSVYIIQPFKLMGRSPVKEAPDFQMHSADGDAARYDAAPAEAAPEPAHEDSVSIMDEAGSAEGVRGSAELPTEILLYVSEDAGYSDEDIQREIVSLAKEFQFDIVDSQSNKVILQKNDNVESDKFLDRLSQLGRVELNDRKDRENTLTIQVIIK